MIEWNISITNENIIIYNNDYFIDNLNSKNYNLIFMNINHKLNYDYNDAGLVIIKVAFISKPGVPALQRKEEIIDYIESSKNISEE